MLLLPALSTLAKHTHSLVLLTHTHAHGREKLTDTLAVVKLKWIWNGMSYIDGAQLLI